MGARPLELSLDVSVWLVAAAIIEGFALLAWVGSILRPRVKGIFAVGFNVMLPVTVLFVARGAAPAWRGALVLAEVILYLGTMNWVILVWSRHTALDKLDATLTGAGRQVLAFVMTNATGWGYCLPLYFAARRTGPLDAWDVASIATLGLGLVVHVGADYQKWRFKERPGTSGRVLDSGLWRWSRHPNYFGDLLSYVAFALVGGHPAGWISPFLNWLQYRFDAIPKNEAWAAERYGEAWARYRSRTSRFWPWPPRT